MWRSFYVDLSLLGSEGVRRSHSLSDAVGEVTGAGGVSATHLDGGGGLVSREPRATTETGATDKLAARFKQSADQG